MITKIYKVNFNKQRCNFSVPGQNRSIVFECINYGARFSDNTPRYTTADPEEQKIIESFDSFKKGEITIEKEINSVSIVKKVVPEVAKKVVETVEEVKPETVPTVIEDITTPQKAKEVLRSEPYNVPFQSLGSVEKIKAKAEELGVSFPNVKWE